MSRSDDVRQRIAHELLRIGAVVFSPDSPFTWASGIEAPVYVDNRLAISHPDVRRLIIDGFVAKMESAGIAVGAVVGTATAGIPHAAWLADRLDLPLAYVRSSAKPHGRRNKIEGHLREGTRVVVVEDLVSTGGSSLDAVHALRDAGAEVVAVIAVFSYGLSAASSSFEEANVPLYVLSDFDALVEAASSDGTLDGLDVEAVRKWHRGLDAAPAASRSA